MRVAVGALTPCANTVVAVVFRNLEGSRAAIENLAAALLCLLSACAGIKVDVESDREANFSGFHRYAWKPDGQQVLGGTVMAKPELQ